MSSVSLNSSMRTNLLSLRETAKLQDISQLRLSTGLKVNSAIDNPSAYYTAQALNNRANDLGALLDSMGQGISTIKAATETLNTATGFLQQMTSVATQAVDSSIAKKEVSIEVLKEKGAMVATTKSELKAQLAGAKTGDVIVVMGIIEMGDESLTVKNGVTLAGARYALEKYDLNGQFKAENKAVINFDRKSTTEAKGLIMGTNSVLSDLEVNLNSDYTGSSGGTIFIANATGVKLHNLNLTLTSSRVTASGFMGAINNSVDALTELSGNINIKTSGSSVAGIAQQRYFNIATLRITKDANVNIETTGDRSCGLAYGNVYSEGNIKIKTLGALSHGLEVEAVSTIAGNVDAHISGASSYAIKENLNILGSAKIMLRSNSTAVIDKNINVAAGAIIGYYKNNQYTLYQAVSANIINNSTNFDTNANYNKSAYTYEQVIAEMDAAQISTEEESDCYVSDIHNQPFNNILSQYDSLIKDSSYKGINLLKKDDLKINFNENGSNQIIVKGQDASSEGLGLKEVDWKTLKDVENSLRYITNAISTVRSMTAEFGNYYSIISTRQNFTENMINILNEGRDKLTLADMNEESANMLALEVRQQLSVNSLSLASQSLQSILKLF